MSELLVETFEIEGSEYPTADLEQADEMKTLMAELGMVEATKIVADEGVIPFRRLSQAEHRIWQAFCPNEVSLERFKGQIPLRVLKIMAECKRKEYFKGFCILTETETNPDPVVLGIVWPGDKSWDKSYYAIARWGESLMSWPELAREAQKKWIAKKSADMKKKMSECEVFLKGVEHEAIRWFNGDWINEPA